MLQPTAVSFDSHVLKLERAKEHFETLKRDLGIYGDPKPHRLVSQDDIQSGECSFRFEVLHKPPPHLGLVIGDCLQNARSSLDHLLWQIIFRLSNLSNISYDILERATGEWLEDGTVLLRLRIRSRNGVSDGEMNINSTVTGTIVFDPKGKGAGRPVLETLAAIIQRVEEVIRAFHAYL